MEKITTEEAFHKTINSPKPVVLKFETTWCPDCKRLDMFIDDIVKDYEYKWYVIDRDEFPQIGEKYEVLGIPSLLIFQNGEKKAHLHSAYAKTPDDVRNFFNHFEA
ncbi:thioredoxin family protein [Pueribacillus sp. YX66]|uniref:thioredoxin family protein n=1 Tax=Pueribacillus sp. YX66 TaxID=3229242 RepID=UPI00358D003A